MKLFALTSVFAILAACATRDHKASAHASVNESSTGNDSTHNRTPASQLDRLGPAQSGICRAYKIPTSLETKGCVAQGPYQGEISGETLKPSGLPLEDALKECVENPLCSGISADWYLGASWSLLSSNSPFAIDESSYGCSFLVGCP